MVPVTELLCILVDNNFQRTPGGPFLVEVPSNGIIVHLKKKIKEEIKNDLAHVDARRLEVWRLHNPRGSSEIIESLPNLHHSAGALLEGKAEVARLVPDEAKILSHFSGIPDDKISVLVHVGGMSDGINHGDRVPSEAVKKYRVMFIKVEHWKVFGERDIGLNGIHEQDDRYTVPDFVTKFERMLDRKPGLLRDVPCSLDLKDRTTYFEAREVSTIEDESHEETQQPLRDADQLEALHIAHVASYEWETLWRGGTRALKECLAYGMFFSQLLCVPRDTMTKVHNSKTSWPFRLVTECVNVQRADDATRMYKPCSDFLISKSKLPRLIVEINSTPIKHQPPDLIRMLLSGAAVVRFANNFLKAFKEQKNFVLCAVFIYDDGGATRFILFQQQDNPAVFYRSTEYSLDVPGRRVEFTRQLYNLLRLEVEEDEDKDTRKEAEQLDQCVTLSGMNSLYGRGDTPGTTQKRRRMDVSGDGRGGGRGQGPADSAELRAHGYEVQSQVIVDADGGTWEPLFGMPSHIQIVYRPRPEEELIAKKVREESNELAILTHLNTIQPRSEHVISLLDSFYGQSGTWIILPRMGTISGYIVNAPQRLQSKTREVCWGLIEGLAFLHERCIAHRDIKPDNLVVDQDFCLKIIDFDIAIKLKDEDEKVDGECGTKYWMAPEVDKNSTMYSPIRADRWSCGRVLLYLLDELKVDDERLEAIGRKLKVHDPNQRPSLVKWESWLPVPPLNIGDIERKASRPRQDSMVVDEGDTTAPNAKKQRLAALDVTQFPALDEPQASVVRVH